MGISSVLSGEVGSALECDRISLLGHMSAFLCCEIDHPYIHSGVARKLGSHMSIPASVSASQLLFFIPCPSSYKP